jgi:hypothetical protein
MRSEHPPKQQELLAAIDGWHANAISESDAMWLKDQLRNSEQARRIFIEYGDMLASLAFTGEGDLEESADILLTRVLESEERTSRRSVWQRVGLGAALTVTAMLLLVVGFLCLPPAGAQKVAAVPSAVKALAIAVVTDLYTQPGKNISVEVIRDAVATHGLRIGTALLANDELRLEDDQSFLELTFTGGARLVLQGPAHLVVGAPLAARLKSGRAVGFVPPAAVGFVLDVPGGIVRDLGTEFAVDAALDNTQVSVLTGVVECELGSTGEERKLARLDRGAGVRMDALFGTFVALEGLPKSLSQIVEYHTGIVAVRGEAEFIAMDAPLASEAGKFPSSLAQIYPERQQIFVKRGDDPKQLLLTNAEGDPGTNTPFISKVVPESPQSNEQARVSVDSYFLRARAPTKTPLVVTGSVTFRREIVAALTTTEGLNATDEAMARPEFAADWKEHANRSRGSDEGSDRVTISPDGKTLTFTLQASGAGDEMRILVRHGTPSEVALAAPVAGSP